MYFIKSFLEDSFDNHWAMLNENLQGINTIKLNRWCCSMLKMSDFVNKTKEKDKYILIHFSGRSGEG